MDGVEGWKCRYLVRGWSPGSHQAATIQVIFRSLRFRNVPACAWSSEGRPWSLQRALSWRCSPVGVSVDKTVANKEDVCVARWGKSCLELPSFLGIAGSVIPRRTVCGPCRPPQAPPPPATKMFGSASYGKHCRTTTAAGLGTLDTPPHNICPMPVTTLCWGHRTSISCRVSRWPLKAAAGSSLLWPLVRSGQESPLG